MEREPVQTRITTILVGPDSIMRIIYLPGAEERLADAEEAVAAAREIAGDRCLPLLVDMRKIKAQDRGVRDYYNGPDTRDMISAVGLLVGSRVSSLIANFFISVTARNDDRPIRMFTDEAEALAWLRGLLD